MVEGAKSRRSQAGTQTTFKGKTDGDEADGSGALGADEEPARPGDTNGPGGRGRAACGHPDGARGQLV
ncbi:hypothetical protein DPX16_8550 [Anabarilius grahami]|uniref:Uncharacterized protein n=1 Tax=Anabarilius grahami TaxID=495550 RepID=A0A3N0Y9M2_ANAGA|nr:hypothetical protein DPX16_8550 [Anabarilius grahami]